MTPWKNWRQLLLSADKGKFYNSFYNSSMSMPQHIFDASGRWLRLWFFFRFWCRCCDVAMTMLTSMLLCRDDSTLFPLFNFFNDDSAHFFEIVAIFWHLLSHFWKSLNWRIFWRYSNAKNDTRTMVSFHPDWITDTSWTEFRRFGYFCWLFVHAPNCLFDNALSINFLTSCHGRGLKFFF